MRIQLPAIASSAALLSNIATASEEVKLFTSNGVVYSYAVITSTVSPASVYVETLYYTTTRVKEVTLDNSIVTSTTERVVEVSTRATSTAPVETQSSSTASTTGNQAPGSRSISTLQPPSTSSSTYAASTGITSSGSPGMTTSTLSPTSTFVSSSSVISGTSLEPYTTVTGTDGTCSVYYDDADYYSTVYLTGPSQSVDAATTLTSTMTFYVTSTLL